MNLRQMLWLGAVIAIAIIGVVVVRERRMSAFREEQKLALIRAIDVNRIGTAMTLLRAGADVNQQDQKGRTPLHAAFEMGNREVFSELLKRGARMDLTDGNGATIVHRAAEVDDPSWLREVLAAGADPDAINVGNRFFPNLTPLFYAIYRRQTQCALELIKAGANVDHLSGRGERPFEAAAGKSMYQVMLAMVNAGVDPAAKLGVNQDQASVVELWTFYTSDGDSPFASPEDVSAYPELVRILQEKQLLK